MRFKSVTVRNYKSIREFTDVEFGPGFNVIVGPNNVGKTAFVEAISLIFEDHPHRSIHSRPHLHAQMDTASIVNITFEIDVDEMRELFIKQLPQIWVKSKSGGGETETILASIFQNTVNVTFTQRSRRRLFDAILVGSAREGADERIAHRFDVSRNNEMVVFRFDQSVVVTPQVTLLETWLCDRFLECVYKLNAIRASHSLNSIAAVTALESDASNIHQVLHNLRSSRPHAFAQLEKYFRSIFPNIAQITTPLWEGNAQQVQTMLGMSPVEQDRNDLTFPLAESGTGVTQVLAMLYVVVTSREPQVIIIDEPQSFLHPGALRLLFRILREHPQHQYIVTTHSPIALTAAEPNTVHMITHDGNESFIEPLDIRELSSMRRIMLETGTELSDVFGASLILWVEGPTEENAVSLVLETMAERPYVDVVVRALVHTGDFETKKASIVPQIYERLSSGTGLLPPAIGFLFDRETRSEREMEDIRKICNGRAFFTGRRMFENYLLIPKAIAELVNSTPGFAAEIDTTEDPPIVDAEQIAVWIEQHRWNRKYFGREVDEADRTDRYWQVHGHAAQLLDDMFKDLSEKRVMYETHKVVFGEALTRWICAHALNEFDELIKMLREILLSSTLSK